MKNAVIFDLDGTLWDSSQSVTDSWNDVFERYPEVPRRITNDDMHGFMGKLMYDIAAMIMPDLEPSRRNKIMDEAMDHELEYLENHSVYYYPALRETLGTLSQKYSLIIVSNCQDGYIQLFLRKSGLSGFFCDFESAGVTGLSKGGNISLVIRRNAIDRAVYVGDTLGDMQAADDAGIPFIHAAYGFGKPDRPTAFISDFSQIIQTADEIFKNI